jgi:hypothetical protein
VNYGVIFCLRRRPDRDEAELSGCWRQEHLVGTIVGVTGPDTHVQLVQAGARLGFPYAPIGDALAPRAATGAFREGRLRARRL